MDAPGVGLQSSETGEHQDCEEEGQHGDTQRGVCDQGQRLQISFQLLLIERREEGWRDDRERVLLDLFVDARW